MSTVNISDHWNVDVIQRFRMMSSVPLTTLLLAAFFMTHVNATIESRFKTSILHTHFARSNGSCCYSCTHDLLNILQEKHPVFNLQVHRRRSRDVPSSYIMTSNFLRGEATILLFQQWQSRPSLRHHQYSHKISSNVNPISSAQYDISRLHYRLSTQHNTKNDRPTPRSHPFPRHELHAPCYTYLQHVHGACRSEAQVYFWGLSPTEVRALVFTCSCTGSCWKSGKHGTHFFNCCGYHFLILQLQRWAAF